MPRRVDGFLEGFLRSNDHSEGPYKGLSKNREPAERRSNNPCHNKMVIIYWTCGGVAKVAIIVTVRSLMDQTNHLAASRKFGFPEI